MATIEEVMAAGWRAFQAGDLDRAEQAYRLVLEHDPSTAQAWYMLGAICQVRGRLEEAVVSYREALRLRPGLPRGVQQPGGRAPRTAAARRGDRRAPPGPDAAAGLRGGPQQPGQCPARRGADYDEAVRLLPARRCGSSPTTPRPTTTSATCCVSGGRVAEAIASYDRALELKPDQAQVHLSRALAWLEMGDSSGAGPSTTGG